MMNRYRWLSLVTFVVGVAVALVVFGDEVAYACSWVQQCGWKYGNGSWQWRCWWVCR